MIRADLTPSPEPPADTTADVAEHVPVPLGKPARAKRTAAKPLPAQLFPPLAAPSWARASGRADGDPLFFAGAALALLDAHVRCDPRCAGALRQRLALQSALASAKILRLNADAAALRDLRFAVAAEPLPAAKPLQLWRELAGRPPNLDARRLALAAGLLDLPVANADARGKPVEAE